MTTRLKDFPISTDSIRNFYIDYRYRKRLKILKNRAPVIISLTSTSSRIDIVDQCIKSVFTQEILPEKVILWVDENIKIPSVLKRLLDNQLFVIKRVPDIGPHTKLFYALKDYPDKTIITVDDDTFYPGDWLIRLYKAHKKFPSKIICLAAREISFANNSREDLLPYKDWPEYNFPAPVNRLMPLGKDGILYPPGCLSDTVFDTGLMRKLCPTADDFWFWSMAFINKTEYLKLDSFHENYKVIKNSQLQSLYKRNVLDGENDKQIRGLIEHFKLLPNLI